jgi:Icc-related predicted phosphoesterase
MLHYSPIRATVDSEPAEILAFLGSSRLEEPINRYGAAAVLHGHAHHGAPEGRTSAGVPVYNVSIPVLSQAFPGQLPFRVLEIPVPREAATPAAVGP